MADIMDAWKVNEKDFPENGSDAEKLAFCVRYAILAPSAYNTQPWYFKIEDNTLSLFIDRRYALPVTDPEDRELTMFCSAALFNLRLAIHNFGYAETTALLPEAENEDLIARVKLGQKLETMDETKKTLFQAIPKRHMNRGAFKDKEVPEDVIKQLQSEASMEGAWLNICSSHERKAIVRMISEADYIQSGNKHFRRELASWVNERRKLSGDGIPSSSHDYATVMNTLTPTIFRRFENADHEPANDQQLEEGSPVIAILGSKSGGAIERVSAGQALMRLLLAAEANGVAVSLLNQPCEVPELRLRLHDELEYQGRAQMILRLGYGGKPSYTPRRPLSTFLEFEGRKASSAEKSIANDAKPKKSVLGRVKSIFSK